MPTNWRVYGKNTLASRLDRSDLPGFFRRNVVVGPNEAAIVMRDGQVQELLTESKVQIAGVFDQFLSIFRAGTDIAVYFVDLSPLDLTIFMGETNQVNAAGQTTIQTADELPPGQDIATRILAAGGHAGWLLESDGNVEESFSESARTDVSRISILAVSADKEVIQAECRLRLHVDPENAKLFVGLLKGKKAVASWDLAALLRDELFARVLVPEIVKHPASAFRSNRDLQNSIEQSVADELGRTLDAFGLALDSFTISWGRTEQEQAEINRRRGEREEEALKFSSRRQIAHLLREQEIEKTRIANLQELKMAKSRGDEELADLLIAGEIRRDLMAKGKEVDEAQIDAQVQMIKLDVEKHKSSLRIEEQRAAEYLRLDVEAREFNQKNAKRLREIETEDKELRSMVRMQIENASAKHDLKMAERRQEIDAEFRKMQVVIEGRYQQGKLKLQETLARMGMITDLLRKGLDAGAVDSGVLTAMLHESTEQEYATTSDAKVQSRSEAQAAANNLETHKQAEDRERQHQAEMTKLSSDMMQSAKQQPPSTVVTGGGVQSPAQPPSGPVIINNTPGAQTAKGDVGENAPQTGISESDDEVEARLAKLQKLLDMGAITEEEFTEQRKNILADI